MIQRFDLVTPNGGVFQGQEFRVLLVGDHGGLLIQQPRGGRAIAVQPEDVDPAHSLDRCQVCGSVAHQRCHPVPPLGAKVQTVRALMVDEWVIPPGSTGVVTCSRSQRSDSDLPSIAVEFCVSGSPLGWVWATESGDFFDDCELL